MPRFSRILVLVLAVLVALPALGGTPPIGAKKPAKGKTVSKTFSNNGQIAIPGTGSDGIANPFPAPIQVRGFKKGKITDVNLTLKGFSHGFSHDVDVLLVAPNGRTALVMSDVGSGSPVSNLTLKIDDQAGSALPFAAPFTGGTFKPANHDDGAGNGTDDFPAPAPVPSGDVNLAEFKGGDPNGTWKLFVRDDDPAAVGSISGGWSLEIEAKVKKKKRK